MSGDSVSVTGCILAGGRGQRFDGADKGLLTLASRPLIVHVLERVRPQVDRIVISANRHQAWYRALGVPVLGDASADYPGPLAGFLAALRAAPPGEVVVLPCDSPFIPLDLVARLRAARAAAGAAIAVVRCGGRLQPVFTLLETTLATDLAAYLDSGQRKIDRWFERHAWVALDCEADADAFANINTPADLEAATVRANAHAAQS